MRSDRELIDLYRAGNEEAFSEFYGRHRRQLFVLLLSLAGSRETAEDLLQETFFAFLRSLDRLDKSPDLRPFLVRTARNLAIDHLRRKRSGEKALERRASDLLFRKASAEDPLAGPGDPEKMNELILGLPEEQREAIVLKIFLGMTFREIAHLWECPEDTVVSRYRYGIGKIRACLAPGGCHD